MSLTEFLKAVDFYSQSEVERAKYLAFFHYKINGEKNFDKSILEKWFDQIGFSPNLTRLFNNIKSKKWSKTDKNGFVSLNGSCLAALAQEFPNLNKENKVMEFIGDVLPKDIYSDVKQKHIKHICNQINWAYEVGAYDACAVMMRRLLEILLVYNFQDKGIDSKIKGTKYYKGLDAIIAIAISNEGNLTLDPKVSSKLEHLRNSLKKVGDNSAHDIMYICQKNDISPFILDYKLVITHLLQGAGFKN